STTNRYIKSKVDAEDAIVAGFDSATILRPSVVFGSDDVLFNRMARIAAALPLVMPIVGSRQAKVQPVFVGDVAAAVVAVLAPPRLDGVRAGRTAGLLLPSARRAHAARHRPQEADHWRARAADEDRGLLSGDPRQARVRPPADARSGRSAAARHRRSARRQRP